MKNLVGYSEFIEIFKIKDSKGFLVPGVEVRPDGIWVVPPSDALFPEEAAALGKHPKKNLKEAALSFPCTFEQIEDFLKFYGIKDCPEVKEFAKMQEVSNLKLNTGTGGPTEGPFDAGEYSDSLQNKSTKKSNHSKAHFEKKFSFDEPIERDPILEKALWLKHIDPIIKTHNIKTIRGEYFQYQYFDKSIDRKGVDSMLRKTMSICRQIIFPKAGVHFEESKDLYGGADCFITEIVCRLRDAERGPQKFDLKDGGTIYLKNTFRDFLNDIFKDQTLPEFLELLRCEILIDKIQGDSSAENDSCSEDSIDQLVLKFGKAAEHFYRCIYNRLSAENKNLTHAEKVDLKTAALKVFDARPTAFFPLIKEHIEGDALYLSVEKQKQLTIGRILRNALMSYPSIGSDYQKLYKRYIDLKKTDTLQKTLKKVQKKS